jgi:hypothetical protein
VVCSFSRYFFFIAIAFYSFLFNELSINKKIFYCENKKNHESPKIILMKKIYFSSVIIFIVFPIDIYFYYYIIK